MHRKSNTAQQKPNKLKIARIYELLGDDVVLLPLRGKGKNGKAPIDEGWQKISFEQTRTAQYQQRLRYALGVGVKLGTENICTIDVDQDEWVEPLIRAIPKLAGTLRTRGARGAQFWLKMKGDFPHKKITFKTREQIEQNSKEHVAEFRTDGCQSAIRGLHPKGNQYQCLVEALALETVYDEDLPWPREWIAAGASAQKEKEFAPARDSLDEKIKNNIFELCRHFFPLGVETSGEWRLG
jgi:hypothetical protein